MARHGSASRVEVKLYMEGILMEDAFDSVRVSGHTGAPSTAEITLVPTDSARKLQAGTWIHVFTTDPWDSNPTGDMSDFKLLFEGIIISRGMSRTSSGRFMKIQCADPSVFWVEARQYWINLTSSGGGLLDKVTLQTSGGYSRITMNEETGRKRYMIQKLTETEEQGEERFLDTLVSVLDDIGNVNPYYTNARNRFRITDRIVRASAGATDKLFQLQVLGGFFDGIAGRQSGQDNLSSMVNSLLDSIMHEWVSIPAPPYISSRVFLRDSYGNIKRDKKTVTVNRGGVRTKKEVFSFNTGTDDIVASIIFKPHIYTLSPPKCNVLFPNMYQRADFSDNFLHEPTRVVMRPQLFLKSLENALRGFLIKRPTELEIFTALTRDKKTSSRGRRTPDGKYADGAGQAPAFHDYDWTTNEERVRGIVYNFINLAPAPGTLTMTGQGKRKPDGSREGGVQQYLQNVASYEFYKSKYQARSANISGPYNMRPVPGFSALAMDDSPSGQNMLFYLDSIDHYIQADGSATTNYGVKYPRYIDELDLNRPKFKTNGIPDEKDEIDLDLVRDPDTGLYDFGKAFDGNRKPPIPEWFADEFKKLTGLNNLYKSFFGSGVVEEILFDKPEERAKNTSTAKGPVVDAVSGAAPVVQDDNTIELEDAVAALNSEFRAARETGREELVSSNHTNRLFTRIDQAFRFVGAGAKSRGQATDEKGLLSFDKDPANIRKLNFNRESDFVRFVGDGSTGSGYSAIPESGTSSEVPEDAIRKGIMSGVFTVFDTSVHTGEEATDEKTRNAVIANESGPSNRARYDGRPLMFDFEFRIWQQSLADAGITSSSDDIANNAKSSNFRVVDDGKIRAATPEEQASAHQDKSVRNSITGGSRKTIKTSMTPAEQAPTGDSTEGNDRLPLSQPLSEKQVIDLRRSIVDAYREELRRNRGFEG